MSRHDGQHLKFVADAASGGPFDNDGNLFRPDPVGHALHTAAPQLAQGHKPEPAHHDAVTQHPAGHELGWGDAAWSDAGGFENILSGYHGGGPVIYMPVENLEINNNTLISNHLTENTNVIFNAGAGSEIDVGGDVNALSFQSSEADLSAFQSFEQLQSLGPFQSFSIHPSEFEQAWGGSNWSGASGMDAFLVGELAPSAQYGGHAPLVYMPIDNLVINNNTFVQNTLVENTNIIFNAANGGEIDVGGDVTAAGSQQALLA
jgi:hypothetical protein